MIRRLSAPLLSLVLLIAGSGLLNTFVAVRLEIENVSIQTIGMISSTLYLGMLLGSLWIGRWISRVGHIRSFIVFAALSAFVVLAQAIWIDPLYWGFLRLICGLCSAGIFIVIESWFLLQSPSSERSSALSLYLVVFYAALTGGQFLFNLTNPKSAAPFCITALLFALSILPILNKKISEPKIERSTHLGLPRIFRISPLGFMGGLASGMLLAIIYTLIPIYAKEIGLQTSEIGTLMGVIIFGGLSFQWPLGKLADKTGRRRILNTASFMTMALAIAIPQAGESSFALLSLGWLFGGFSFTIYPLSMTYICEKVPEDQIISVTGGFILAYGIGAIAGPLFASMFMSFFGSSVLFYFIAAISICLCLFGLKNQKIIENK
ncbi:MAG TPA: MFS transporter [Chlamydiales bacterium]|nr:MFS transporter [Chlamydiales bacterium]